MIRKSHKTSFIFALSLLIFCIGLSIIGPAFVLDKSKDGNDQEATLSLKPPGFTTHLLVLNDEKEIPYKTIQVAENGDWQITDHFGKISSFLPNEIKTKDATRKYILGTDKFGRDLLSRIVKGVGVSLLIGFFAVLISLLIGTFIGSVGGYFGGKIDQIVMFIINVMWSIPTLLLVMIIVLSFGRGISGIFIAVGLTLWVDVARLVRGQVLSVKENTFIVATKSLGYHWMKIIFQHIMPNIIGPLLVIAASNFAIAILIEAGLSYLGFGVQPPAPSLGNILYENYGFAISGKSYLAIYPALSVMLLVLSFNLIGTGLRDIFDVRTKTRDD